MSTDLKTMMDDAAAGATRDLRVDLVAVRARASERRREVRRRAASVMTTAAAVAATIVLAVVLLPGPSPRATSVEPAANAPTGLPDRWFDTPTWIPPVTRKHMPAASMVLRGQVVPSGLKNWESITGPVLVSADGRSYAGVPWGVHDKLVALRADGRWVAWVTQEDLEEPVVHRLELATGEQHDDRIPRHSRASQLVWGASTLWLGLGSNQDGSVSTWVLRPDADAAEVCACGTLPLAVDAEGNLRQPPPASATVSRIQGVPVLDALVDVRFPETEGPYQQVFSQPVVLSPDGTRVARAVHDERGKYSLEVGGTMYPLRGMLFAQVLAWTTDGVLMRVATKDGPLRSLSLYSPDGGWSRIVSRPSETSDEVGAVAADLTGGIAPGAPTTFSDTDRSHVRYLSAHAWDAFGSYVQAAALALVLLLTGLLWWRRSRRRKTGARDQSAQSSGGAGPAGDGG